MSLYEGIPRRQFLERSERTVRAITIAQVLRRIGLLGSVVAAEPLYRLDRIFEHRQSLQEKLATATDVFPGYGIACFANPQPYFGTADPIGWYTNELVFPLVHQAAYNAFSAAEIHSNWGMGDIYTALLASTHQALDDSAASYFPKGAYPDRLEEALQSVNYRDELLMNFVISTAALLNSYTPDFDNQIGSSRYRYPNAWDRNSGYLRVFNNAGILRKEQATNPVEYNGVDRLIHASHHMALVVLLGLSQKYNMHLHLEAAGLLSFIPDYLQMVHKESALSLASLMAGYGFELKQTLKLHNLTNVISSVPVQDGYFDNEWRFDIRANLMGCLIGLKLLRSRSLEEIMSTFTVLNTAELRVPKLVPTIPHLVSKELLT